LAPSLRYAPVMAAPDSGASRRKLVVGLALIALAAALVVFLVQRAEAPPEPPVAPEIRTGVPAPPSEVRPPTVPLAPPPPAGRSDLLAAAAAAASAYGSGAPAAAATQPTLTGRRFRISLPFGCSGPGEEGDSAFWRYGPDRETIRVSVRPEVWTDSGFVRELGGSETFDAVEGFWIRRPWAASEDCPAARPDPLQAVQPAASPETVGLAVFYGPNDSRVARRDGRPYEVVAPAPDDGSPPAPRGYRLVLEGRVTGFPGGAAVRCRSPSVDQRPVCLIGVQIDLVQIRDPAAPPAEAVLGEWRS